MAGFLSTTNTLAAGASITLGPKQTDRHDNLVGTVFSDQGGTLFIEQSPEGINWDVSRSIAVAGGTGQGFSEGLYAPFVRLRYVNGATAQTVFRLYSRFGSAGDS